MGMMLRRYHDEQGPEEAPAVADAPQDAYDPADFTVAEVAERLEQAADEERTRILEAEAAGKNRKGIIEWEPPQAPAADPDPASPDA